MVKERLEELSESRVQVLQVYQTIGPDGKLRNKVKRVFKEVDTASNNNVAHNEENSQMVEFCNNDVTEETQRTLESLVDLEELEELSEPTEVLKSSREGGQVQVLQVYRTLGPDGVVRNRVRRVFKKEGTSKKVGNNRERDQTMHDIIGVEEHPEKTVIEERGNLEDTLEEPEELSEAARVVKASPERKSRLLEVIRTVDTEGNIRNQVRQEKEDDNKKGNVKNSRVVRFCQTGGSGEADQGVQIFKGDGIQFLHQLRMQV